MCGRFMSCLVEIVVAWLKPDMQSVACTHVEEKVVGGYCLTVMLGQSVFKKDVSLN